jgi:sulfide dehydrogenase cytochrome subunit
MKYKKIVQSALVLGGLALSGAVLATPSGDMLGNTCAGCHGTHGNSNGPATPSIAGIANEYFIEAMKAYKDGTRPSTVMTRIAKGYTDEEIEAMAKYFAGQKYRPLAQKTDSSLARLGKQLHDRSCEKCHEDGGTVSEDGGILAGQPMPYLHWSIEDFLSGKREMPKKMKTKMEEVHKAKGDEAYKALVNFYGSQGK